MRGDQGRVSYTLYAGTPKGPSTRGRVFQPEGILKNRNFSSWGMEKGKENLHENIKGSFKVSRRDSLNGWSVLILMRKRVSVNQFRTKPQVSYWRGNISENILWTVKGLDFCAVHPHVKICLFPPSLTQKEYFYFWLVHMSQNSTPLVVTFLEFWSACRTTQIQTKYFSEFFALVLCTF